MNIFKKVVIALSLIGLMWLGAVLSLVLALVMIPFYKTPYTIELWRAIDIMVNNAIFNGKPGETISENAGRLLLREDRWQIKAPRWAHWVDTQTNRIDQGHARDSIKDKQ